MRALPTGDYSLEGLEDRVAVERKSKEDLYKSLGGSRARFERAVERLSHYAYGAIVVEATFPDFLVAPEFTRMRPGSAMASILGWSVRYDIPVFFCGDRSHGRLVTMQLLAKFDRYEAEGTLGP